MWIAVLKFRGPRWLNELDYLTTRTSLSPIRRGFAPGFIIYKKGCTLLASASDKSLPVACPWSVVLSGFFHHQNWSPWYSWNIAESGVKHQISINQIWSLPHIYTLYSGWNTLPPRYNWNIVESGIKHSNSWNTLSSLHVFTTCTHISYK